MIQKVLKVGSSAAVTLSKETLKGLGLKIGDAIVVEVDKKRRTAAIKPIARVDSDVVEWTEKFIKRYRPALEALAKK